MSYGEDILPKKEDNGIQLGVGISSANLYLSGDSKLSKEHGTQWIQAYKKTDHLLLRGLRVLNNSQSLVIDAEGSVVHSSVDKEQQSDSMVDELLDDDDDDQIDERDLLLSNAFYANKDWKNIVSELPTSFNIFTDVAIPEASMYKVEMNVPVTSRAYVPKKLISNLQNNSLNILHESADTENSGYGPSSRTTELDFKIVDPMKSQIFTIGRIQTTSDLRTDKDGRYIIAYASGATNSILNISLMHPLYQDVETENVIFNGIKNYEISNNPERLELYASIKSIKIPQLSPTLNRDGNIVAIITETSLFVLRILSMDYNTHKINVQKLEPLDFCQLEQFPYVDFAFNPWNLNEFAVIDTKGNWCLGEIARSRRTPKRLKLLKNSGSIFDPEEVSNWKRIEWSSKHTRIFVMSRSSFTEIDYADNWQQEIVQAKTWSKLRDFKRINDSLSLLLTSKEIIFLNHFPEITRRVLSWKHSWNNEDASLRCSMYVSSSGSCQEFYILLYSRVCPFIVTNLFTLKEGVFQASDCPALIQLPNITTGISNIVLSGFSEIDEVRATFLALFVKSSKGNSIWRYLLTTMPCDTQNKNSLDQDQRYTQCDSGSTPFSSQTDQETINLIISKMLERLPKIDNNYDSSSEFTKFQGYGYSLSELINKRILAWDQDPSKNLKQCGAFAELTDGLGYFESVEEYSSLLQQIAEYYEEHGLRFSELATISKLLIHEPVESLAVLFNKLLQCWEPISENILPLTKDIIQQLSLDIMTFFRIANFKELETKTYESLIKQHQELLDTWDADCDEALSMEDHIYPHLSKGNKSTMLQPTMPSQIPPTIRSSQAVPSSFQSSLPETQPPAFSLMSQQSQLESTPRPKKKKKIVGGFR